MMKRKKNPSLKTKDECMKKKKNKVVVNKSDIRHISEDLIIEILLRLPPTSVLRFKCVCKTWYSLISNPDFLRTHSSSLQFYKHTTTTDDEELMVSSYFSQIIPLKEYPLLLGVYPNELLDCYLINSCNGLQLLHKISHSSSYYVCNPLIKHCFKIPSIRITENFKLLYPPSDPYILFDPSISLSYKLIWCLKGIGENNVILYNFYVYSSDIGSWRLLRSFPSSEIDSWGHRNTAVLLNGIFYLKTLCNCARLVCFDLKKENVWFLPLPPNPVRYSNRICFYFGECDGRLRLIEKYLVSMKQTGSHLTIPCSFDIMETEEPQHQQQDGNLTWSVKYHVNINTGYVGNYFWTFRIIQLYKTKKNEGEEEALLLNIYGMIVPFHLKNNTFGKELRIQNPSIFDFSSDYSRVFPSIKTTTLLPLLR